MQGSQDNTYGKRARILLADDEPLVRDIIFKMLKLLGYDVIDCENGRDAIKYYQTSWKDVDLVILDIVMPEMDGRKAFLSMREINPKLRVLLISGYRVDSETQKIISNYEVGFIQKPFSIPELGQRITEMLEKKT